MKAALDVHYEFHRAIAACVVFRTWQDSVPMKLLRTEVETASRYRPGRFYERELPCLLAVLDKSRQRFDTILIDGYVHLKGGNRKGLGLHLFESLPYPAAIIGVAKTPLKIADRFVSIMRGRSRKPLFISAIGCPLDEAALSVLAMHGPHRIPTLLKLADHHARGD